MSLLFLDIYCVKDSKICVEWFFHMNFEWLAKELDSRNDRVLQWTDWCSCAKLSVALVKELSEKSSLEHEVQDLRTQADTLEQEITNNSEFGKLSRDLKQMKEVTSRMENERNVLYQSRMALTEEMATISKKYEPLRAEGEKWKQREEELRTVVQALSAELAKGNEQLSGTNEAFSDMVSQVGMLEKKRDELEMKLLRLREREAELRNNEATMTVPQVDFSAMQCPLPRGKDGRAVDEILGEPMASPDDDILDHLKSGASASKHNGTVTCIAFSNSQPIAATGGEDGRVHLVNTETCAKFCDLTEAKRCIMSLAFSPLDQLMLTACYDGSIRIYKVGQPFTLTTNCNDNRDCVNDAKFITDDKYISCCRDHTVKLYDVRKGTAISSFTSNSIPYSICSIQGESMIVTGHHDGKLRVWDFRVRGTPTELPVHKQKVIQVYGTAGSSRIVSLGQDKMICVSDIRSKSVCGKINIAKSGIPSETAQMAVLNDEVLIGGNDGQLYDYSIEKFTLTRSMKGHNSPVCCVAIKRSVGLIASGDKSGVVKFWNK